MFCSNLASFAGGLARCEEGHPGLLGAALRRIPSRPALPASKISNLTRTLGVYEGHLAVFRCRGFTLVKAAGEIPSTIFGPRAVDGLFSPVPSHF
jgi:hypothetical protein